MNMRTKSDRGATPSGSCKQNNSTPFKDKWEPGYSAHNLGDF